MSSSSNTGLIVGLCIAGVVVIGLVVAAVVYRMRANGAQNNNNTQETMGMCACACDLFRDKRAASCACTDVSGHVVTSAR
jgi:hypothetical protein